MAAPPPPDASPRTGVFVTGSTLRHVLVMTATGAVGLMAIFIVDLLSLLYVSWLGRAELTAAVGYATIVLFIATSINIGLMIAASARVARALGAGDRVTARAMGGSALAWSVIAAALVALMLMALTPVLLPALGAKGETLEVATRFLLMTLPSNLLMALGMGFSGLLRAVGDARRAMFVTLAGGLVTAVLDPILIFGFGLGVDGAAITIVVARLVFALVGWHGTVRVHGLAGRPRWERMHADLPSLIHIAGPAVLTNLAPAAANAVTAAMLARFGDAAIAAGAIIDRIVPVAFGAIFALSGAIGPILAQNWGAGRYTRMRAALRDALLCTGFYVLGVWAALVALRDTLPVWFGAQGLTAELVTFFCLVSGPLWLGIGGLFVANAAFNNLGFPFYATAFNWGRATLGTIPFAWAGALMMGAPGVVLGAGLGAALFGIGAIGLAFRAIGQRARERGTGA